MKRILVIEDDLDIQEMLKFFLEDKGYEIITSSDGVDGTNIFFQRNPDLVLLDILLPKMDGYAVCELIRKKSDVPIIMISALDSEMEQVKGFDLEIDDYIPKPISFPIMLKKIEAVLRRTEKKHYQCDSENRMINFRDLSLDLDNNRVYINDEVIDLTKKEYEILKDLLENIGRIITRDSFLKRLWCYEFVGDERAVDNHIKNLRKKLGNAGEYIETVRGVGYRIDKIH